MPRGISRNSEKKSVQPVVRSRPQGTPIQDNRVPTDEREYVDVEVDSSGNLVTPDGTLPRF